MKRFFLNTLVLALCIMPGLIIAAEEPAAIEYSVGVNDVLNINIIKPERMDNTVTVAPDGSINFPYVGSINVKGMKLSEIQNLVQAKLSSGFMKYPVVSVSLKESKSRRFFVYGEVMKPGTYLLTDNITVLKAISVAGGFNKYGSSSRVKVLRPKGNEAGYYAIRINIKTIMSGASNADIILEPEDIVVVSEGIL